LELNVHEGNIVGSSEDDDRDDADQANIEDDIVFLTSSFFLGKVVDLLDLVNDEEFFPSAYLRDDQQGAPFDAEAKDADGREGTASNAPEDDLHIDATLTANLLERLSVGQIGGSNVVSIAASSIDPVKAARIANAMATLYLEHRREARRRSDDQAIQALDAGLQELRGEVAGLEGQILDYKIEHGIEDFDDDGSEAKSVAVQRVELTTQLALVKAGLAQAEARRKQFAAKVDALDGASAPTALTSPALRELRAAETNLLRRRSQLAAEFGAQHPLMINVQGELDVVRERMQDEVRKIQEALSSDVAVNLARAAELEAQLDLLDAKSTTQQQAHIGLLDLKQRSESSRALLDQLLERRQTLLQQRDLDKAKARIMSPAAIPTDHAYPAVGFLTMLAAMGGLALAGLGVFFYDRWVSDFGFVTMDQLRDFEITPLGVVPNLCEKDAAGSTIEDYAILQPQSAQAEAFQRIRTKLLNLETAKGKLGQIVLVTSSLPLEGKTSTSVILARQAAKAGVRTLLIDADLRRPRVHEALHVPNQTGLAEILTGQAGDDKIIRRDSLTPLEFLPAGGHAASPADLFRSPQMDALISQLRQFFGWIVIDSPPLGAVVDSLVLSAHADWCVFVARWRETTRSVVMSSLSQLRDVNAPLAGLVLSRVDTESQRKYGDVDLGQHYGHYQNQEASTFDASAARRPKAA
jgi:capsular exopolysaccharide synthesis family protein